MITKVFSTLNWLPSYYLGVFKRIFNPIKPKHIYFCICDHFEPYWKGADKKTARRRIQLWLDQYPRIGDKYRDSDGLPLKYTFFYPEEEYQKDDLDALAELCRTGFGEVEIHLHHDNDTSENLRRILLDYKTRLHEVHGLLSKDKRTGEIAYGFIHGNWALDNSRPDGRWCGVNNEISILLETGCYADFTMPSAPDPTQTGTVNSIYYAVDDPASPKSHDSGKNACVGNEVPGLLMVQGPLTVPWYNRKWGIIPRIENGGLMGNNPPHANRINEWVNAGIHVDGAPEHVFVKIYTHGTQERNAKMLFNSGGLVSLFEKLSAYADEISSEIHYVSARELTNIVLELISGSKVTSLSRNNFFIRK
jgi:hypothetical protein